MSRRAWATIKLSALKHNLSVAKQFSPDSKLLAVIKANGYGHGMIAVAHALAAADGLAVACLDEGVTLRKLGITQPILLLEGPLGEDELELIAYHQLSMVVHQPQQIEWLEQSLVTDSQFDVWLKIDTGMHRLGFSAQDFFDAMKRLQQCAVVSKDIKLLSHLANADVPTHPLNQRQLDCFNDLPIMSSISKSFANSAAIITMPEGHYDWVRAGIMLYGCSPLINVTAQSLDLQAVMTLQATLISIKTVKAGESVGYGSSWLASDDTTVGIVSIGYGDGYPRHVPSGTPVLVNGVECPIIGRISMDTLSIDLTHCFDVCCGDSVVLWGDNLPIEVLAQAAETISYELLCGVTGRVDMEYCDE